MKANTFFCQLRYHSQIPIHSLLWCGSAKAKLNLSIKYDNNFFYRKHPDPSFRIGTRTKSYTVLYSMRISPLYRPLSD
jgi:hypothetical protein